MLVHELWMTSNMPQMLIDEPSYVTKRAEQLGLQHGLANGARD